MTYYFLEVPKALVKYIDENYNKRKEALYLVSHIIMKKQQNLKNRKYNTFLFPSIERNNHFKHIDVNFKQVFVDSGFLKCRPVQKTKTGYTKEYLIFTNPDILENTIKVEITKKAIFSRFEKYCMDFEQNKKPQKEEIEMNDELNAEDMMMDELETILDDQLPEQEQEQEQEQEVLVSPDDVPIINEIEEPEDEISLDDIVAESMKKSKQDFPKSVRQIIEEGSVRINSMLKSTNGIQYKKPKTKLGD